MVPPGARARLGRHPRLHLRPAARARRGAARRDPLQQSDAGRPRPRTSRRRVGSRRAAGGKPPQRSSTPPRSTPTSGGRFPCEISPPASDGFATVVRLPARAAPVSISRTLVRDRPVTLHRPETRAATSRSLSRAWRRRHDVLADRGPARAGGRHLLRNAHRSDAGRPTDSRIALDSGQAHGRALDPRARLRHRRHARRRCSSSPRSTRTERDGLPGSTIRFFFKLVDAQIALRPQARSRTLRPPPGRRRWRRAACPSAQHSCAGQLAAAGRAERLARRRETGAQRGSASTQGGRASRISRSTGSPGLFMRRWSRLPELSRMSVS